MKRHFLLLIILFVCSVVKAQETYHFCANHPQGFSIESNTKASLSLHYAIKKLGITQFDNGEAQGQEIILKGCFGSNAEGLPNLPFENRYIAVPRGAMVSIEVKERASKTLSDIDLLPAAAVRENAAVGLPQLHKDMSVFGKDANFPTENVVIAQTTQIRGLDVALLSVTPFRYNPVRKTLEVIYDMDIEVRFEGGDGQFGDARYRNPDWDHILRDLVINSDMLPEAHYYERLNEAIRNREEGCEYLIISLDDDSILAWADTLKKFRTKQGILTKVVTTTECGGNAPEAIKSYIQNAYENWTIPPAALMIFSGIDTLSLMSPHHQEISAGIPGFPLVFLRYHIYELDTVVNYFYSSDNPYADMNDDSIPDLVISRLPALTYKEYQTQVKKLIQYETNPPTDFHYYDQPIISSGYEDNKWFMLTSQGVNGFYRNKLGKHPKNFYVSYDYETIPDTAWSTEEHTATVVDYFGPDGQNYISRCPDTLSDWRNKLDNSYLKKALNQSSFLTLYRDHSASYWWCCPEFYSSQVAGLSNTEPTFLLSIGCDAALYANTHHGIEPIFNGTYYENRPIVAEFCKNKVGALGGIGATSVTHSLFNDILTWGIVDNFWPDFMPSMGTMDRPEFTRPAYALVAGKLFLNQHAFMPNWWPQKVTTTHNVFHYLGETYLNLYTEMPQQMEVSAPMYYVNNQNSYDVIAEEGAMICLSKEDEIVQVAMATGQPQTFTISAPVGDQFCVTVTKQNCYRFEQTVISIPYDKPFVYMKEAKVKGQDGMGTLNFYKNTDIDITLHNYTSVASESAEIMLESDSPYIEIIKGTAQHPIIEPQGVVTLENAFKVKVKNNVPDQTCINFTIRFHEGENTHVDSFQAIANAPAIQIDPEFRPLTADGEPSTHISTEGKSYVTFSFKNIGHSTADYFSAELSVKAPFVSVGTPRVMFEDLLPNDSLSATYELTTTANEITGAWLQSSLDIQYGDCHAVFDTIIQYGGIFENFETDTLNPYFLWTNNGSHKWEYCSEGAYEGQRCLVSTADTVSVSLIRARLRASYVGHDSKISFRYKTGENEFIQYYTTNANENISFTANEWQYGEVLYNGRDIFMNWKYCQSDLNTPQAKLDDLCFPPMHTAIAYAGDDVLSCEASMVELRNAYAYDCNSVFWITEGDGHFEDEMVVNPTYFPGNQDVANGEVKLTLHAVGESDTLSSATRVHFVEDISLGGIIGDSVVNKYENQISQYSVEYQSGLNYIWQLEPAEAGIIYSHGNVIDLVWNQQEGDEEVTLSVKADNGCEVEPVSMTIQLLGTWTPEYHALDFELYPNPTQGKVNVCFGEYIQGRAVIEVFNLLGERVVDATAKNLCKGETMTFDLKRFGSGLYVVSVRTEYGMENKLVSVVAE